MSQHRLGLLLGIGAYAMWGLFPLYFKLLSAASPLEVLAHRVLWSLVFVALLLAIRQQWAWIRGVVRNRRVMGLLLVSATAIALNWGIYIWAVDEDRVVEASLGYFINPLVTVAMGVLLLKERLRRGQWVAVSIGSAAVVVLTVDYGRLPWIALTLAASFATYGLVKKTVGIGSLESLAVETALLFLPFLGYLLWLESSGEAAYVLDGWTTSLLLMTTGVVTAIPLLMFGGAARRIPLSMMGLLQYITPVIQFALGVYVFGEAMPASRWIGFGLVWLALAVLTYDSIRDARRRSADPAVDPVAEPV
jgi:chloramphenicol-sensitive protein RarD